MQLNEKLSKRDQDALAAARSAGIRVVRHGRAWRFVGQGVDVISSRPAYITATDIQPVMAYEHSRLTGGR